MQCPRCNQALETVVQLGVEVDVCQSCSGLWLDPGEGLDLTRPDPEVEAAIYQAAADQFEPVTGNPISCLKCNQQMERRIYARSKVEIDRCGCGVWLDGGEAEKIRAWRRKRLDEIADRFGSCDPMLIERTFSRAYFDIDRHG